MKQRREHRLRHVVADYGIGVGRAEVTGEPGGTLSERRVEIRELGQAACSRRQHEITGIEGVLCGDLELLAGGQRFVMLKGRGRAVVRNNSENSLVYRFGRVGSFRCVRIGLPGIGEMLVKNSCVQFPVIVQVVGNPSRR